MKPILRVANLSKQYEIGKRQNPNSTLRETLVDMVRTSLRGFRRKSKESVSAIWALKDVAFEVVPGEVVAVIGTNGAGKSTLLKILSRITEPTTGRIELYGRVGSLLEVGTGFHSELTGRENIYLNGSILGMRRAEIDRKFDDIVAFAEVETFIDTPVKRYSSGMYVRLAFAVAAHLEPEVLIIDEVLAVGDLAFQKKCLGKIGDVARDGRTVLFVSHSMDTVQNLCSRAILLRDGRIEADGPTAAVVHQYLSASRSEATSGPWLTPSFRVERVRIFGSSPGEPAMPLEPLTVELDIVPRVATRDMSVHISILGEDQRRLLGFDSVDFGGIVEYPPDTPSRFTLFLETSPLPPGNYLLDLYVKSYSNQAFEHLQHTTSFEIAEKSVYGNRLYDRNWHGQTLANASLTAQKL